MSRSWKRRLTVGALVAVLLTVVGIVRAPAFASGGHGAKPTVVLVHGAWADASGWNGVVKRLQDDGYPVAAIPNELRSLSGDAANVRAYLQTIPGPIVLVGHSYGGAVITNAATGLPNVRALVYIDAFAPDQGEDATSLAGPDSALSVPDPTTVFTLIPPTLPPTPATDLYLKTPTFLTSFANGIPARDARILAATQRPATIGALGEPSGVPAWKTIRSWYLIGTKDLIIPPSVERTMGQRAGSDISYFDAGHLGLISDPQSVTRVIERAVKATA
ncbi:alpha/beta fold hydrolase [Actinoplanes sp. NPDC051513]|uniref:alpha/beta fold hydrolase n=1 Tax=Actinoplanes sp. NPDC051513 TaxID=3363908 RepID=UPI00379BE3A0